MENKNSSALNDFMSIKEASLWASNLLGKNITTSNISYLIQYGRIKKNGDNGNTLVSQKDLLEYYNIINNDRENEWKNKLGSDLNWALSFEQYKEAETTKHVHRLHPYKGKFIPQLVEYFLDSHIDLFKTERYFNKSDIILDPFAGSGTTLVQANELGQHCVGIDISAFNALISNSKITKYDLADLKDNINIITKSLSEFLKDVHYIEFEKELLNLLNKFNGEFFPVPAYKYQVNNKEINEKEYGIKKEREFLTYYNGLVKKYNIQFSNENRNSFFNKWYFPHIQDEINLVFNQIKKIENYHTKKLLSIILSRTIRSCRATKHADLATLFEPVTSTYYCSKHGKICKPLFSIVRWWKTYTKDTISRIMAFDKIRSNTLQICVTGDSRTIDLAEVINNKKPKFAELIEKQKIAGIFSSPPYVGLIDYHEQHAYAYELFGFERKDDMEIGPMFKGQGKEAQQNYIQGIADVLNNCKRFLVEDYNIFLVANDKYNMYPIIANKAGMKIVNQFKRPVLNRTEKDKGAYSEIIFHFKKI
ncbi:MAG: DNA methyltransferase [bacterium]